MSRKFKKSEEEVLQSKVNMDGQGEDPAVQAMLSDEFVHGTNLKATEIALALQQLIRGQNSILNNQDRLSEDIVRLRQRMDEMDKTAERWETDRERFVQEVLDKAASLTANGFEKDKVIAKGSQQYTQAIEKAKAEYASDLLKFKADLERMPKVTIVSPGELVMVMRGGQQVARLMNEVVKIKNMKWVLPIGKAVEVPLVVSQVLEERRRVQDETAERAEILTENLESKQLERKWNEINTKYNSTTDTMPVL